jgi:DNA invertase Pin-like site-specific DNA recombinase
MKSDSATKRPTTCVQEEEEDLNLAQELVGEPDTIAYVRVSGESARFGLETSRARLTSFGRAEGWRPAFLEDCGSSVAPRPGFDALIEAIRRGFVKRVLVAEAHHLVRNLEQLVEIQMLLRSTGGELIAVSHPPGSSPRAAWIGILADRQKIESDQFRSVALSSRKAISSRSRSRT